jgi:hypothetical protein
MGVSRDLKSRFQILTSVGFPGFPGFATDSRIPRIPRMLRILKIYIYNIWEQCVY